MATPIPPNKARFSVWDAAAATGGRVARARGDGAAATGVTADSRAVTPGCTFVALRGGQHDGHAFVDAAVRAGAALLVIERGRVTVPAAAAVDVVEVPDTLVAWGDLARSHLRRWRQARWRADRASARVVAVTGSAGKTTTRALVGALLGARAHCAVGNLNNRVGVPAVAFGVGPGHAFAVFELGMSLRGEIDTLARIVEPDVGILTNVGLAHAAGLGGGRGEVARADVALEKGALFDHLSERGVAIACADDDAALAQLPRARTTRTVTFGRDAAATARLVERRSLGAAGAELAIDRRYLGCVEVTPAAQRRITLRLPLLGEAAALDFTAALAAADAAHGFSRAMGAEAVAAAARALVAVPGRLAPRALADGVVVLDDTYNANPTSVRAALEVLTELAAAAGARKVAVLGEMRELGPSAADEHARMGEAAARAKVDLLIGCGGLMDRALDRAAAAGVTVERAGDVAAAAAAACRLVRPGDIVLVKGSRGVATEQVVAALAAQRGEAS